MNNKGADQTARMCRLICAFDVRIGQKQVFSWQGSNDYQSFTLKLTSEISGASSQALKLQNWTSSSRSATWATLLPVDERGTAWLSKNLISAWLHAKTNKIMCAPTEDSDQPGCLCMHPVWSESSLCTSWVAKDSLLLHSDSKYSDQTGRMPRLIRVFAGQTGHLVGFVVWRPIWNHVTIIHCNFLNFKRFCSTELSASLGFRTSVWQVCIFINFTDVMFSGFFSPLIFLFFSIAQPLHQCWTRD